MFDKLLVANRGEIAVRIIRAAKELNLRTVAVYSEADKDSLAVRYADEAICIGPAPAAKSYLNIDAIIAAARETGAGAIHPGYGFLAENARFAEAVTAAGLVFVGPTADTIRMMGDKAAARIAAQAANVPIVPGSEGEIGDEAHALDAARAIGFPVMLKASAGGGGRGIRVATDEASLKHHFHTAQAEALAAFGSGAIYLERFLNRARHLEVQVLGDGKNVMHCFERECSLQRRRQKIWEEAPSPAINDATRQALCASAVRLAERAKYRGAGTLEYLYDEDTGEFFFIEMNTRIQVEHPVTEMVTGHRSRARHHIDRAGRSARLRPGRRTMRGAAIEVRINAEDPDKNFRPSPGPDRHAGAGPPAGRSRRHHALSRATPCRPITTPCLPKSSCTRKLVTLALARLRRALDEFEIEGVITTASLHKRLAELSEVRAGEFDTGFLERLLTA